ncbi:MAG: dihydrofolate reductase [Cytophagaceae bacterium]|nr:dihydrofolate reductase [Cytophagaceae bacterium]
MRISLIAAMGQNRAMGLKGRLPWPPLPEDWDNLHRVTAGRKMIMGRKTYDTPDRVWSPEGNLVITRQRDYEVEPGFERVPTLEEALERYRNEEEVFVLGGAKIFEQALPLAGTLHLTLIHGTFEADTFFPEFDRDAFLEISRRDHPADERHPFAFTFFVYERKSVD